MRQIDGETVKTMADFIFLGSKITADGDCSHKIKRLLLLGRKAMTSLDSILKCRDMTLPTKVHLVKAMFFPVVMYGCESWTIKKAEHWRVDAFELWCWRRLLRVPWTARRSNQSILKEISPGCSLERLMLKLKETPILWPPDVKGWLIWKDPDAGTDWGQEKKGTTEDEMDGWHHRLNGHEFEQASRSWWWTGRPGVLRFMGSQRVGHGWATELNWCSVIVQICFLKLWRLNTPVKSSINCKWQRGLTAITLLGQERPREREWVLRFPSCGRDTGRKKCSDLYKENNHSASTLLSTEVRMPAVLDEVMSQEGDSLGDDILVIYC